MKKEKREEVLNTMVEISHKVENEIDTKIQKQGNITYYKDFEFQGSGLGIENVYIVEILNEKQKQTGDNQDKKISKEYQIYDKDQNLIATVREDGKVQFTQEYLKGLEHMHPEHFKNLELEDLEFKLPEELKENDIMMMPEEIKEYSEKVKAKGKNGELKLKTKQEEIEEKQEESEETKKEKTAEALGVETSEIKSIATINPREKITDKHNLIDIMPETSGYKEVSIVYSNKDSKGSGKFTIVGAKEDGSREVLNSVEPVEGTTSSKSVIAVNEDGSQVTEKQVTGLMRINARSRDDGIAISIGDYGMMNIDYVRGVMDKEHRRATPIRTKSGENQRVATSKVRENAGDSKEEIEQEGRNFRKGQEADIDSQSIDGIDIDKADGTSITLDELKEQIKEEALEQGDMSREENEEFIKEKIELSGLELSEEELEATVQEVRLEILDESRFGTRGEIPE